MTSTRYRDNTTFLDHVFRNTAGNKIKPQPRYTVPFFMQSFISIGHGDRPSIDLDPLYSFRIDVQADFGDRMHLCVFEFHGQLRGRRLEIQRLHTADVCAI